jgi:DNA polymerase-3 subunit epsilon
MQAFVEYIGNAVLVGHRIYFDIEMINDVLEKMECGKLKNEALDIEIMHQKLMDITNKSFSLEDLIQHYKLPLNEKNSASDDAYSIALLFLKLKSRLGFK